MPRERAKPRRCHRCGYDVRCHLPGSRCPECGTAVLAPWVATGPLARVRSSGWIARAVWGGGLIGVLVIVVLEPRAWPALWMVWLLAAAAWLDTPSRPSDDRHGSPERGRRRAGIGR